MCDGQSPHFGGFIVYEVKVVDCQSTSRRAAVRDEGPSEATSSY
jgi:hypothetical protein